MSVRHRIFGHGVDIALMARFNEILKRHGERFIVKALHPKEITAFHYLTSDEAKIRFVSSRWALKEAVVKASGKRLLFPEMLLAAGLDGTCLYLVLQIKRFG